MNLYFYKPDSLPDAAATKYIEEVKEWLTGDSMLAHTGP